MADLRAYPAVPFFRYPYTELTRAEKPRAPAPGQPVSTAKQWIDADFARTPAGWTITRLALV